MINGNVTVSRHIGSDGGIFIKHPHARLVSLSRTSKVFILREGRWITHVPEGQKWSPVSQVIPYRKPNWYYASVDQQRYDCLQGRALQGSKDNQFQWQHADTRRKCVNTVDKIIFSSNFETPRASLYKNKTVRGREKFMIS